MHLHFKGDVLMNDLHDLADAFISAATGHQRHKDLAVGLRDPSVTVKRTATFTIVANCISCSATVMRHLHTVWQRGSPVEVALADGTCPHCQSQEGFAYSSTHSMHA
jgi:hypothetical protein